MCRVCRPSGAVGVGVVDDSARQAIEKGEAGPELLHLVKREQQHRDGQRRLLQDGLPEQAPELAPQRAQAPGKAPQHQGPYPSGHASGLGAN